MELYHVSSYKKSGDILNPKEKPNLEQYQPFLDSLGQGLDEFIKYYYSDYPQNHILDTTGRRPSKWACEVIFESVRMKSYPSLPSRLDSVYLYNNFQDANDFQKKFRPNGRVFRAVPYDKSFCMFDMNLFTKAEEFLHKEGLTNDSFVKIENLAKQYWKGCEEDCVSKEVLYNGIIKLE